MAGVKLEPRRSRGRFFQRQVCRSERRPGGALCDQPLSLSLNSTGRGFEDRVLKWISGEWHLISRTCPTRLTIFYGCCRLMCMWLYVSRPGQFVTRLFVRPLAAPPRAARSFAVIWLSSERSGRLYACHSAALACAWRACSRINQSSVRPTLHRILMLVAKVRNRKWRLISRTCCPPPAAALRATQGACGAL